MKIDEGKITTGFFYTNLLKLGINTPSTKI